MLLVDSVRLVDTDSLYLGRPYAIAVAPSGDALYVSDDFNDRVIRYDRSGVPRQLYGKRGPGPGEFRNVSHLAVGERFLYVSDSGSRRVTRFSIDTAEAVDDFQYTGALGSMRVGPDSTELLLGAMDASRGMAVSRYDRKAGLEERIVSLPPEYRSSDVLRGVFPAVYAAVVGENMLVSFQGLNDLFLHDAKGELIARVPVPVRQRRGVPADIVEVLAPARYPDILQQSSALVGLHVLPSGEIATLHHDVSRNGPAWSARVFVSVLSSDLKRACVDAEIPNAGVIQPRETFRGDTVFIVDQAVPAEEATAIAYVRSFWIDTSACVWIVVWDPTSPAPPHGKEESRGPDLRAPVFQA